MKGAAVAAWKQAARAEWAASSRFLEYACNLLDLVKAFERVPHNWLIRQAVQFGYPLKILKLSIGAYRLCRVLIADGVCSTMMLALRGIVAGSVLATIELRVLLIQFVDETIYRFPLIILTVYVDDTGLECAGPPRTVVATVSKATAFLTESLQSIGLEFSHTKNMCLASAPWIADSIVRRLPNLRLAAVRRAKSLGGALGGGKLRNATVIRKRLESFKTRKGRFKSLRRAVGASRTHLVLRTGGTASLTYGQANMGVANATLLGQRRAVAAAGSREGAGDLDFTLMLIDGSEKGTADPAYPAHAAPIASWAEAIWCSWLPRMMLERVVTTALNTLQVAKSTWAVVSGPGLAFVASAQRLGWSVHSSVSVCDDRGRELDFTRDPPALVQSLVYDSVRRWRWRRIEQRIPTLAQGSGGFGAHFAPIRKLLKAKANSIPDWGPKQAGAL